MNYNVNFQKAKRNYMTLTFDDEREVETRGEDGKKVTKVEEYERRICVGMPKKRTFSKLIDMQDVIDRLEEAKTRGEKNEANREIINSLYELVEEILSNNKNGETVTAEWVESQFSIKELKEFLIQYTKFTNGEATNPN